jgi:L-amino acid N-acyltransferase YncA
MALRKARPSDAPNIARVYVNAWRSAYAGILPDNVLVDMSPLVQAGRWNTQIERQDKNNIVLVMESHEYGVIGVGSAGPGRDTEATVGEVYTLYVEPDWHGMGVGRLLLEGLFHQLEVSQKRSAMLWVLAANPARFFYEAVGGQRMSERTERIWGTDLPEIAYVWDDLSVAMPLPDDPPGIS